ncbi:UNVERIFIED_ORG: hypothetical protein J2W38_007419 [Variovorax paradoxus]|jgi:hypothetical protein|nr:hypothetical protein [Variovorax paradoxus]
MAARSFADKFDYAAWHDKPSWCLVTENDSALAPQVQHWIAQNIGVRSTTLRSSHISLASHPQEVAALTERAVREAARGRTPHSAHSLDVP